MDAGGSPLPDCINPNNFPAKLWRLVNNPIYKAIRWDSQGETIIIDRHLFEQQVLSPCSNISDSPDAFKTTNFSSFVRQLNLYGFRKVDPVGKDSRRPSGEFHTFSNPKFKRNHPERVASLRRLTVDNKAKMQAGMDVNCRPPSRGQGFSGGSDGRDNVVKRGSSSLQSPTHEESTHPCYSKKAVAMTSHKGTPVPPRYLMRGHSAALSSAVFAMDKGMPLSLSHQYPGVASGSTAVHIPQGFLAPASHGSPNFTTFNHPNVPFQPGFYSPVCQCYQQNLLALNPAGSRLQTGPFSPHKYYQATFPVDMLSHGEHNQVLPKREHPAGKKCDINLDTIFQIADEMMQTPPNSCLVRVVTPEKPSPVLVTSPTTCKTSPANSMRAKPVSDIPVITTVQGNANRDDYKQQEESEFSVPERMPEGAICEVTSDDAKNSEVVEVSNTSKDTTQV